MTLSVNDKPHQAPDGATVEVLLASLGLQNRPCAVEVNNKLIPKRDHASATLNPGDRVELVTLVGGG